MDTDYDHLWAYIIAECTCELASRHGVTRWRQLEHNGRMLAARTSGAVVRARIRGCDRR